VARLGKRLRDAVKQRAHLAAYDQGYVVYGKSRLPFGVDLAVDIGKLVKRGAIPSPRVVFDIGANVGDWSAYIKRNFPQSEIEAFEPVPDTFQTLSQRVAPLGGVRTWNCALGAEPGHAVMAHTGGGGNTLVNAAASAHDKITVEVNTLDRMSAAQNFPAVDLLKIDCEGFEMPILRGAAAVLAAPGPRLVFCECEFHKGEAPHGDFFEIYQHLTPMGYKFVTLYTEGSGRDGFIFGSALFLRA
jgi:FkbM family methyltransferase